ncbi:MAG TPA: F0F1 ATP synthase subunit delta [Candidatus Saccharimonadales bacterium]|nr:F0F1 ATP synthase subunit delta [Candidatus Saccharimonadales bacterium]
MAPKAEVATPVRRLELPILVFGPIEVRRLSRELEALEDYMSQSFIREPGKQSALPKTSRLLDALAGNNNKNLLVTEDRQKLAKFLKDLNQKAPVIHVSLAADPSSAFTAKLVAWLRTNIHPYALLQLGLQPSIAAGCVLRTNNKTFDFSLRNRFDQQRDLLVRAVGGRL